MLRAVIKPVPSLFTLLFSWIAKSHFLFSPQIPNVSSPNVLEQDGLASSSLSELEEAEEDSHISLRAVPAHTCSAFPPDPTGERSLLLLQPSLHCPCTTPRHFLFTSRVLQQFSLLFHVSFLSPSSRLLSVDYHQHAAIFPTLKPNTNPWLHLPSSLPLIFLLPFATKLFERVVCRVSISSLSTLLFPTFCNYEKTVNIYTEVE